MKAYKALRNVFLLWFCIFWGSVLVYGFIGVVGKMFEFIDWLAKQSP